MKCTHSGIRQPREKGAQPLSPELSQPVPSAPDKSKEEVVPAENRDQTDGQFCWPPAGRFQVLVRVSCTKFGE